MAAMNDLGPPAGTASATCPSCGELSRPAARFCWWCGTSIRPASEATETRKTVTIVFCDLVGSTAIGEQLEAEAVRTAVTAYFVAMRRALERHGGRIEKFIGDAVMAVFGVPELHEDDALRAVRAAHDMRAALAEVNVDLRERCGVELHARVGVNTGEVVAGDPGAGQAFVTGDAVNVAARLEQAAGADEILVSETTYRLVRDAVRVEAVPALRLKGKASPVPAFRLAAVLADGPALARRLEAPFVGRAEERRRLEEAFRAVVDAQAAGLVLIAGHAGVGKTRLAEELAAGLAGAATVVRARCLAYGVGLTFWTLGELVRDLLGLPDLDSHDAVRRRLEEVLPDDEHRDGLVERIEQLLGLSRSSSDLEQASWVMRRLLEVAAEERPVVVLLEDLQWARPPLLDLVEHVVAATRDAPVCVLALARSELLEERGSWRTAGEHHAVLELGPLADEELRALARGILGGDDVDPALLDDVVGHATGNPLFLEELLRMLVEEGRVVRVESRWERAPGAALTVPPTVEALVAARLERLAPAEQRVLEVAAVAGQSFWAGALHALLDHDGGDLDVEATVDALRRKGLVASGDGRLAGEPELAFSTGVLCEVAYRRLLKRDRATLHEALTGWLTDRVGERVGELDEFLGYHLEQAVGYRSELGPLDDEGRALGVAASQRLASAGRRALARGDVAALPTCSSAAWLCCRPTTKTAPPCRCGWASPWPRPASCAGPRTSCASASRATGRAYPSSCTATATAGTAWWTSIRGASG